MPDMPLRVAGTGAVTSVGWDAAASAAAMRCRLNCFAEIEVDAGTAPLVAAAVGGAALLPDGDVAARLGDWMAQAAAQACTGTDIGASQLPVLACLMDPARPGRATGWDASLVQAFARHHGRPHPRSRAFTGDAFAVLQALACAQHLIYHEGHAAVLLVAADTWLLEDTLLALAAEGRCRSEDHPDAMVAGEAAAALLLERADDDAAAEALFIGGWSVAEEAARVDNDLPNLAQGLCAAMRGALAQAGQDASDTDLVLLEGRGEAFYTTEACMAGVRTFQGCARMPETWLTSESLGATGAAAPLLAACWLREAHARDYHPGFNSLWHGVAEDGRRGAIAFTWL